MRQRSMIARRIRPPFSRAHLLRCVRQPPGAPDVFRPEGPFFSPGGESNPMPTSASLDCTLWQLADAGPGNTEDTRLKEESHARSLDRFLASVERRAFRIAQVSLRNADDALDVVQGAMLRLAQSYGTRPQDEWQPLFYRILYNGIRDAQRRRGVRSKVFGFLPGASQNADEDAADPLEQVADPGPGPSERLMAGEAMEKLEVAVGELPARQREVFVLRCLEGLDVAATAAVMGCSEGSVKTHYFRALQALRGKLTEVWA
jgi:RNA polymerase sigma-70 factor, ECF subfamily